MCISNKYSSVTTPFTAYKPVTDATVDRAPALGNSISVPTFRTTRSGSLAVSTLTPTDIAELKSRDPFMYYSIPGVRRAEFGGDSVDVTLQSSSAAATISRRGRISAEVHPDVLLQDSFVDEERMEWIQNVTKRNLEEKRRQQDEEEEECADEDMLQQFFDLISEDF